jgi:hypothetical protein
MVEIPPPLKHLPPPPPPSSGATPATLTHTAPPVGVREGDALVIGVSDAMTQAEMSMYADDVRDALGVYVRVLFVPGHQGVTVLRPER